MKKIEKCHQNCASALLFAKGGSQLISAYFSIKVWGLKSGRKVNEMRGHGQVVNAMEFFEGLLMTCRFVLTDLLIF